MRKNLKNAVNPISEDTPWYSRGYLPRCNSDRKYVSLTIRLVDALPAATVQQWKAELHINKYMNQSDPAFVELRRRIAKYEDQGFGVCWLNNKHAAQIVEDAFLFHDGRRYRAIAWCVMPNHAHILVEKMEGFQLEQILHSWKSFTASQINKLLGRTGEFWEREGFDRDIRNDVHFDNVVRYIENNPVAAGLINCAENWPFSSARRKSKT